MLHINNGLTTPDPTENQAFLGTTELSACWLLVRLGEKAPLDPSQTVRSALAWGWYSRASLVRHLSRGGLEWLAGVAQGVNLAMFASAQVFHNMSRQISD